jgi:hypothetical protein
MMAKDNRKVKDFFSHINPQVALCAETIHRSLLNHGCGCYVKTIYAGYDLDGKMVAALYPHPNRLEIALALSEDVDHELLVDASHLTWRDLPVAAVVTSTDDLEAMELLIQTACSRVESGMHDVYRETSFFIDRNKERRPGNSWPRRSP